jgi:hypothetical protein
MKDLNEVRDALIAMLGDGGKLPLLNARLILRTGVTLTSRRPGQPDGPEQVTKVLNALREMGFELAPREPK